MKFAADIPAYVTVRFEARDQAHAEKILFENLAAFEWQWSDEEIIVASDAHDDVPDITLSPVMTIHGEGGTASGVSLWVDDADDEPAEATQ